MSFRPASSFPSLAVAAALSVSTGLAARLQAQNPNGFIQSDQWACLVPLQGNDCSGNGPHNMLGNWVAPHDLAVEEPIVGTVWSDIDFGAAAASAAWRGAGEPTFTTIGLGAGSDVVDYEAYLLGAFLTNDWVMGVAVTYVRNTTGAPLAVGVCTASDDSIQVWINNHVIVNVSVCRGTAADCSEITPAILAPGVNRITTLVWDGFGGFGFRLGLTKPDGAKYTDLDPEIEYLGAGSAAGAVGELPSLIRTHAGSERFCSNDRHAVTLANDGTFNAGTQYTVTEELRGSVELADVTGITGGGVASPLLPPPPPPAAAVGDFADHFLLGGVSCGPSTDTSFDGGTSTYTSIAETGQDIWEGGDDFEFAYSRAEGDFDVSIAFTDRQHSTGVGRWGKFGLMARWSLSNTSRYTFLHDALPDLQDPLRLAGRLVHNVPPPTGNMYEDVAPGTVQPHPLCIRLTRRGNVIEGWAADDPGLADGSVDPAEDGNWIRVGRSDDWGPDAPGKAFIGFANSEHNSDGCAVQTVSFKLLHFASTPAELVDTVPIGIKIDWNATGAVLNAGGVGYEVRGSPGTFLGAFGRVGGAATGGPDRLFFQAPASGPLGAFEDAHDIGLAGPCTPGSLLVDDQGTPATADDTYTLASSGADIWAGGDQFHFAHRRVTGDFAAQAHFTGLVPAGAGGRWGKVGLMARWDCRPNSAYFFAHNAGATNATCEVDGPRTAFRPYGGDNAGNTEPNWLWWQDVFHDELFNPSCATLPVDIRLGDVRGDERNTPPWLRLVRRGGTFYGYASDDGLDWRVLGSFAWPDPPDTILVGVAQTSHAGCGVQGINFDSFEIAPLPPLATETDPGAEPDALEGSELVSADFEIDAENSCPEGWRCNRWGRPDGFVPQVVGGRLRLGEQRNGPLGSGEDTATTAFLREPIDASGAYLFDFDVYFSFDQAATGEAAPADGLTMCVLGTGEIPRSPGATASEAVGDFRRRVVGAPCSEDNDTTFDGTRYTTRATTGRDIWANGDAFEFAYKHVEGDFDMSVQILAKRFPPAGRWGKFGVMARQDLSFDAKFAHIQDHGPLAPDNDGARFARRIVHGGIATMEEPATLVGLGITDPNNGTSLIHPRYLRLTRRGGLIEAWASNTAGTTDPINDANWYLLYSDDWTSAPDELYLGFAYSVHNSSGCNRGEVDWALIHFSGTEVPEPAAPAQDPYSLDLRLGDRGAGLGYNRINNSLNEGVVTSRSISQNSFAVAFDNWHGSQVENDGDGGNVSGWDPFGGPEGTGTGAYHIGLNVNASTFTAQRNHQVGVHDDDLPDIYAAAGVHTRVLYDHGLVRAWVRADGGEDGDWLKVLDHEIDPLELNAPLALIGFTAATGGATCTMEIDNFVATRLGLTETVFHRGDSNEDGKHNISDPVNTLNVLFLGSGAISCQDAADSNDDGKVNISDPVNSLNVLFLGLGAIPPPAVPELGPCGADPSAEEPDLGCASYTHC